MVWDATDSQFWAVLAVSAAMLGTFACGLLIFVLRPTNVSIAARVAYHVAMGVVLLRRSILTYTGGALPRDWAAVALWGAAAFFTWVLAAAIVRAGGTDRRRWRVGATNGV